MDVSELDYDQLHGSVSQARIIRSSKYIHQRDKKLCIGVEILLNYLLKKIGLDNPIFDSDEYGKPYIKNYSDVHFNLTHSQNYVACAISDSPVGVDIEHIHDVDLELAKKYFQDQEYEYVKNNQHNNAFFELWVLKESYMKMTGLGFGLGLDEFMVEIDDLDIKLKHGKTSCKLGLWNVCDGNYMLGVCSPTSVAEPVLIKLEDVIGSVNKKNSG
jgi:4'-phosphopantetheinyl transferase